MNKKIIIIGATSGIGKALFEKYATDGNRVSIVGRRTNLLEELREQYPANTLTATADITKLSISQRFGRFTMYLMPSKPSNMQTTM